MKQGLRWVLWSVCGLLLAASVLWTASRLWGVTDAQRAALAQMRAGWTPAGRNGFAALWTLRRDVPAERQQAVLDADVRTIQAWSPQLVMDRKSAARPPTTRTLRPRRTNRHAGAGATGRAWRRWPPTSRRMWRWSNAMRA